MTVKLAPKSHVTRALCAAVPAGNVLIQPELPTCATGLRDGQVVLIIGDAFLHASERVREHMLRHEAHHIFCNHSARQEEREAQLWNVVCDAAIHHKTNVDWEVVEASMQEQKAESRVVTFDRLKIAPCPPEVAYDRLKDERPEGTEGCGRERADAYAAGTGGGSEEEQGKVSTVWVKVTTHIAQAAQQEAQESGQHPFEPVDAQGERLASAEGTGRGTPPTTLPPAPPWVMQLLDTLIKTRGRTIRGRSWRREHRHGNPLMPGRGRNKRWDGVFAVDASGSIDEAALTLMLAAVCSTPELQGSSCYLFDTQVSPEFLVTDQAGIMQQVARHRGGTKIVHAHEVIGVARPRVWFTDACSSDGLPPQRAEDVWVLFGYGGKVEISPVGRRL